MNKYKKVFIEKFNSWSGTHHQELIIYNVVLIFLFLLHSVGYFYPFFPISINFIVMVGLVLSVFLLGAKSKIFFVVSLIFWGVALFFKAVGIEVWAERTGVYVFQSFVLGIVLLFWESFKTVSK